MATLNFHKFRSAFSWDRFTIGAILLLGFLLRIRQYLTGRSLWLDEAMLALNIVNRDFAGLFRPLDYDQGAPIGFLLVEKVLNIIFGDHEFVFRLFPLIAGMAALGLFYLLLRRTTSGIGLWTGLALFATGPELIYYSSEMKQYMIDVLVAMVLFLLAIPLFTGRTEKRNHLSLGLVGVLTLWFSHPALFVLAGIGIGLFIRALDQHERYQMNSVVLMGAIWLANLGLLYFVSLQGLSQNMFLLEYWQENFMPTPPWSDWGWFALVFSGLIRHQIGIFVPAWIVFVLVIFGLIFLFRRNRIYASVLLLIFVFTLIASSLRLYPLGGRVSLFLAPLVIILISHSLDALQYCGRLPHKLGVVFAAILGICLLYTPTLESIYNFIDPKYFEHIRPSMVTLAENWEEGDALFVSNGAAPAFRFYADRYGLGDVDYQTAEASDYQKPDNIVLHLQTLDGNPRVWVLITHVYETKYFNERDFLLSSLDTMGNLKREFRSPGTSVYLFLYDLSP